MTHVAFLLVQLATQPISSDSTAETPQSAVPRITLVEALRRAAQLDPDYVSALNLVEDAEWARRSVISTFVLPSITATTSATRFSSEFFNIGTGALASQIVDARLEVSYDLFRGGAKFFDLGRTRADLEARRSNEVEARYASALGTESDYYEVLAQRELTRVGEERVRRAEEQLGVARARVLSGAAVQSDSLQLLLELTRAQVDLLGQRARLKVARLQLGRRVGSPGPVDATPVDTLHAPALPLTEAEAVSEAADRAPRLVAARADERAFEAAFRSARSSYLPSVTVLGQLSAFDERFFPSATTRSSVGLRVSLPIWNGGQREVTLSRAAGAREVARAVRRDTELSIQRDVVEAFEAYNTARASAELAARAVVVARENQRVQQERYRAGATTIIDLVTAQVDLAEAEAGLVQARYGTRLALAGLEAILGRRLFSPDGRGE